MKACFSIKSLGLRGFALVETCLVIGVLAMAVPLVLATLTRSGEVCAAARAESRSPWIIGECLDELRAARTGQGQFFPASIAGGALPEAGELMALAVARDGRLLNRIDSDAYLRGLRVSGMEPVAFIVSLSASPTDAVGDAPSMLNLCVSLEYPAASPAARRTTLDFFTRMP
jgi:type II secretory pathway pseudopilin PulG